MHKTLNWILFSITIALSTACTPAVDPVTNQPPVYPVIIAKDAGFTINDKKVTEIRIEPSASAAYRYMYVVSGVPVEAHNSVTYVDGKNHKSITNVELP